MNLPELKLQNYIDALLHSSVSFVLYRLPWTDDAILILQKEGEPETFARLNELNGKRGFVLYPFEVTPQSPALLIRKDMTALGWEAIEKVLESLEIPVNNYTYTFVENIVDEGLLGTAYEQVFNQFMNVLHDKTFRKLVLTRKQAVMLNEGFSPLQAFVKACNSYPRMMISLCHSPLSGTWLGSTPEILLSRQDELWQTVALAGTMPMQGEVMPTTWSEKNKLEQEVVSEYIRKIVRKHGTKPTEKGPYAARAGQLVHLRTDFYFGLKDTAHLGSLLEDLYPTPAICGLPKEEAKAFILENEGYDRSYYSGIIGELDPEGITRLYINLRCMHINDTQAVMYAGGGILASSDLIAEWEETQQKLNTMRNIL